MFAVSWGVMTVIILAIFSVVGSEAALWESPSSTDVVLAVVIGIFFGSVVTCSARRERHHFGGVENVVAYRDALRTGSVPTPIDVVRWTDWINKSRARIRFQPAVGVLFLVLGLLNLFTGRVLFPAESVQPLWLAAMHLLIAAVIVFEWRTTVVRLDRLRARLEHSRPPA
ncbi:hypothetical protein QM806_27585 [Rhodococcus sp. IEGM 1351]|nr:hypothetical protein [Rhodococcus sp. IEGM 1351]